MECPEQQSAIILQQHHEFDGIKLSQMRPTALK